MQAWTRRSTGADASGPVLALPGRLWNRRGVSCDIGRIDREELAADPLDEAVVAVGAAVGVRAEVALDGWPDARVQLLDDRCVVDRLRLHGDVLDHLAYGI